MKLRLHRDICGPECSQGSLYIDNVFFCYTLEDTDRKTETGGEKVYGRTAIPRGEYALILDLSQRFGKIMPRLLGVPGFEGIRIHSGNVAADTDGCVLVGMARNGASVTNSRTAYGRLMILLEDAIDRGETLSMVIE